MLKKEVRIIAWDDCAFSFGQENVMLVGAIFRGASFLDGMLSTTVEKDGMDATQKISASMLKSRHYDQLSYVMTDGISFAGLNILDINELHEKTKLPVLAVIRKRPDRAKFVLAFGKLPGSEMRKKITEKTGEVLKFGEMYYQKAGLDEKESEQLLKMTCIRSNLPEPLRVAHLIASGFSGESKGRA
jgi:hypothetical protein